MRITIETGAKEPRKTTYQGHIVGREGAEPTSDSVHRLQVLAAGAGTLLITFLKIKRLLKSKKHH